MVDCCVRARYPARNLRQVRRCRRFEQDRFGSVRFIHSYFNSFHSISIHLPHAFGSLVVAGKSRNVNASQVWAEIAKSDETFRQMSL